jgi:Tfp pilus assembly protein PilN
MNGTSLTILLITSGRIVRADFDSNGAATLLSSVPGEHDLAIPSTVRSALALGSKPGANVWLLLEDVWIQNVELPKRQIAGLSSEQIGRALSFEIEPFSGTPVAQSEIGFCECEERDSVRCYWAAEIATSTRDAIQEAITSAGGKLTGICHPGGGAFPLVPAHAGGEWRRLEVWHGSLLSLECDQRRRLRTKVLSGLPSRSSLTPGADLEWLAAERSMPSINLDPSAIANRFLLDDQAHLHLWLQGWASILLAGAPPVPFIAPRPAKPGLRHYIIVGALLETLVIVILLIVFFFETIARHRLRTERATITRTIEQIQAVTKENTSLRKEIAGLSRQEEKKALLSRQRAAYPALLRALASTRPDDIVLNGIRPSGPSNLIVNGISLEALSVDEMCIALTSALRSEGWVAQPLQKFAKGTAADSGPWEFAVNLAPEDSKTAAVGTTASHAP